MKSFSLFATIILLLPMWAQTADLSGFWVLVKTEDKISGSNSGAAPPVPGGGTAPVRYPGGRTGGAPAGGATPMPELATPDQERLQLIIAESPGEIRMERRWPVLEKIRSLKQVFRLDGKAVENESPDGGTIVTRSRWNGSVLVNESTQRSSLGNRLVELRIREEYSLARDGQTLTAKTRRSTPYGQSETTQTFRKEDAK